MAEIINAIETMNVVDVKLNTLNRSTEENQTTEEKKQKVVEEKQNIEKLNVVEEANTKSDIVEDEVNDDGKNLKEIKCPRCPSSILVPGVATLVMHNFKLTDDPTKQCDESGDSPSKYWCVNDIYAFENVGFSKTVNEVKYLICADCEIGPLGWHDLNTKLSYISPSKILYS